MNSAIKIVVRRKGRKLCARILWLPLATYMRLKVKDFQSGRIKPA